MKTVREIHDAFDRKKLVPSELVRASLKAARDDKLNACLLVCEEQALARAKVADAELAAAGKVPRWRQASAAGFGAWAA